MLTPFDDYPIHQTPEPIAHPATGDRNAYDRYFFNGYTSDGSLFFALAWGLYPNRSVQDASFSVVRNGVQTSVLASRRAPTDRMDMTVGPMEITIVEPLRQLRISVRPNDSGLACDLLFTASTAPLEEPRFTVLNGVRTVMDYTRLTQFGTWSGWLQVDGERIELVGNEVVGVRDRSWGIRSVGERDAGAPPLAQPQIFWLWAPLVFDEVCIHFDVMENASGRRVHANGDLATVGTGQTERAVSVDYQIDWLPGTRRAERAAITLDLFDGSRQHVELEPILHFQMCGVGYFHPTFAHGRWNGETAIHTERWRLADLDPTQLQNIHVQTLCRATWGDHVGIGILEQLVLGPHEPSGFTSVLDPARQRD